MIDIEFAYGMKALFGGLENCGDLAIVKDEKSSCLMVLIDVLGHGSEARTVAMVAEKCLRNCVSDSPIVILQRLHDCLKGSRGAVVSICAVDKTSGSLTHAGIGNISVRIFGAKPTRLVSRDGVVGYGTIRPKENQVQLLPGDIVMMHSDGIKTHFEASECAGLLMEDAEAIVEGTMKRYCLMKDDASCIILKILK